MAGNVSGKVYAGCQAEVLSPEGDGVLGQDP